MVIDVGFNIDIDRSRKQWRSGNGGERYGCATALRDVINLQETCVSRNATLRLRSLVKCTRSDQNPSTFSFLFPLCSSLGLNVAKILSIVCVVSCPYSTMLYQMEKKLNYKSK